MALISPSLFPDFALGPGEEEAYSTGILPSQRIHKLIDTGSVSAPVPFAEDQIQPASLDLRLGPVAYRVRASFLPNRSTVRKRLEELSLQAPLEISLSGPTVLEQGRVYIVPLLEELHLPDDLWAKANPKSTTGRLDVFTRLITDFGTKFDRVPAGYKGKLYLEVAPQTFSIVVSEGTRLSQLRFWRGAPLPSDTKLEQLHQSEVLVYQDEDVPAQAAIDKGLWLSVDLTGTNNDGLIGYRARRHAPVIDLAKVDFYDPADFWDPIPANQRRYLILDPDEFYILASRERISVPPSMAAEMAGYEPSLGEFRVHYAGFFDPGFGYGRDESRGTQAVLEVRSHQVPYVLEDQQRVARLVFERLQSTPDRVYGANIGSSYQWQGLTLSKQFHRRTG